MPFSSFLCRPCRLLLFFPFILLVLVPALRTELVAAGLASGRKNHAGPAEFLLVRDTLKMYVVRHLERPAREFLDILENSLVRNRILVPDKILLPHVHCHGLNHPVARLVLGHAGDDLDHILDVASVVSRHQRLLGHGDYIGRSSEILLGRHRKGGIHIQIKSCDELHMVPQLVPVVGLLAQMRIEYLHDRHHGADLLVALVPVGNLLDMFYHLLDVPPVLGHYQLLSVRVVIHCS